MRSKTLLKFSEYYFIFIILFLLKLKLDMPAVED